jgi:hypothetical protein
VISHLSASGQTALQDKLRDFWPSAEQVRNKKPGQAESPGGLSSLRAPWRSGRPWAQPTATCQNAPCQRAERHDRYINRKNCGAFRLAGGGDLRSFTELIQPVGPGHPWGHELGARSCAPLPEVK